MRVARLAAILLIVTAGIGACASEPPPAHSVVTFELADGSRYRVLLTEPADLTTVATLAEGKDAPSIPNGRIVRETGVNKGWSWSIDTADFAFVDVTDGSCDTTPEEIEDGTFEGDRFCPWSAVVVAIEPAP